MPTLENSNKRRTTRRTIQDSQN
ncbi:unnamed protein product, partial [Rotaria magnacalcarata]